MAYVRWAGAIADESGIVIPSVTVTVWVAGTTDEVDLFSDPGGTTPMANPFATGADGIAAFFVDTSEATTISIRLAKTGFDFTAQNFALTYVSLSAGGGGGGASTFTGLTDTPSAYTGAGGFLVKVNSGATGLEFSSSLPGHNLLSATHEDTAGGTATRGDIITCQGAIGPVWKRLEKGTEGKVLTMGANEPEWSWSGGGGAAELDDLDDVTITTPASGHVLYYSSGWVNATLATAGIASASALTTHTGTTGNSAHVPAAGSAGQFLSHDGTWAEPAGSGADAIQIQGRDVSSAAPDNLDVLIWSSGTSEWAPGPVDTGVTAHAALTDAHYGMSNPVEERLVLRDASGRAQVAAPSHDSDIATKKYVDDHADSFIGLTDTPANYTSAGSHLVAVNSGATGVEFISEIVYGGRFKWVYNENEDSLDLVVIT